MEQKTLIEQAQSIAEKEANELFPPEYIDTERGPRDTNMANRASHIQRRYHEVLSSQAKASEGQQGKVLTNAEIMRIASVNHLMGTTGPDYYRLTATVKGHAERCMMYVRDNGYLGAPASPSGSAPLADARSAAPDQGAPIPSAWIPVTERLPEERERVLVSLDGRMTDVGFYGYASHGACYDPHVKAWRQEHGVERPFGSNPEIIDFVTGWMPLPDPPRARDRSDSPEPSSARTTADSPVSEAETPKEPSCSPVTAVSEEVLKAGDDLRMLALAAADLYPAGWLFGNNKQHKEHVAMCHKRAKNWAAARSRLSAAPKEEKIPIPWQIVNTAIDAVDKEAERRGGMFPQESDSQAIDRKAVARVTHMIEWYATKGGSVAMRLERWPTYAVPAQSKDDHPDTH